MNAPAHQFTPEQLDDIRARVTLSSVIGQVVKLSKAGREYVGLCPFHQEKTGSFTVADEKGFYHCFGCGAHGDIFRFLQDYRGMDFIEAVRMLADGHGVALGGTAPASPARAMEPKPQHGVALVDSLTVARAIWHGAGSARGEIVEAWMTARGLDPASVHVAGALARLRYHPRCPVTPWKSWEGADDAWLQRPAMVAPIERVSGPPGARVRVQIGVHVTYLMPHGRAKAHLPPTRDGRVRPTRKIWGEVGGGAVWLTDIDADDPCACPLVVGEGIETVLAAMDMQPGPVRGAAALSLGNLQGGHLRGPHGELPLHNIKPDPDRRPFLIPEPGAIIIAVDADMKPLSGPRGEGVKVQEKRGQRTIKRPINGLERAEICGMLTALHWRSIGARPVQVVRPYVGYDFDDMKMGAAR